MRRLADIRDIPGQKVLLRADLNVPVRQGQIQEDFKIISVLPTIKYLLKKKAKIILVSHLGRPKSPDSKFSLRPVQKYLEKSLRRRVKFCSLDEWERIGESSEDIVLLENIRFFPEEEKNSLSFVKRLSRLAPVFVFDAFAVAHHPAASITGVAHQLPSFAGLLVEREVSGLSAVINSPRKPLVVVLGGLKLETKIPVIKKLLPLADHILLGGAVANSFLAARGMGMGNSVCETVPASWRAIINHSKIALPVDIMVGSKRAAKKEILPVEYTGELPRGLAAYDIGPETLKLYEEYLQGAKTIVWNGAMGWFENPLYDQGTFQLVRILAQSAAYTLAGGGETVEVINKLGLTKRFDQVSTGGGAMLEFLSGKKLPGLTALDP